MIGSGPKQIFLLQVSSDFLFWRQIRGVQDDWLKETGEHYA
jgi:hypothetical protein